MSVEAGPASWQSFWFIYTRLEACISSKTGTACSHATAAYMTLAPCLSSRTTLAEFTSSFPSCRNACTIASATCSPTCGLLTTATHVGPAPLMAHPKAPAKPHAAEPMAHVMLPHDEAGSRVDASVFVKHVRLCCTFLAFNQPQVHSFKQTHNRYPYNTRVVIRVASSRQMI